MLGLSPLQIAEEGRHVGGRRAKAAAAGVEERLFDHHLLSLARNLLASKDQHQVFLVCSEIPIGRFAPRANRSNSAFWV